MVKELDEMEENTPLNKGEELTLDDLEGSWVKHPSIGETTDWLVLSKIVKSTDTNARDKEGKAFSTALSGVDFKIELDTDKGVYTLQSWEVWNKVRAACKLNGVIKGTTVKVEHVADGLAKENKELQKQKKLYKVTWKNKEGKEEVISLTSK